MQVAGVDGCPGGWLVVRAEVAANRLRLVSAPIPLDRFTDVVAATKDCDCVAVDIPIGLTEGPERDADRAAREKLGQPRGSSVFRAPCWPILCQTTDESPYADACAVSRKYCCHKQSEEPAAMSLQTYHIMKKVREVNLWLKVERERREDVQDRIFEMHPEVSFWALNDGNATQYSKKAKAQRGKRERISLLSRSFDDALASVELTKTAAMARRPGYDDFLDACVAAWTAARRALAKHETLPTKPPPDRYGLRMEIVY